MCIGPFVPYSHVNQSIGVTDIFFILLFIYAFLLNKERIRVSPIFFLVCIIPLIGFSSLFFNGIDTNYSLLGQSLGLVLKWFFFSFIILFLPNKIEKYGPEPVVYGIFWGCLLTVLWGWYVWSLTPNEWYGFPMLHVYQDTKYTISRNFIGFYSSLGICVSFFFIANKEVPFQKKVFYWCVLILQIYTSLLTFSKGTWVAGFLPIAYYLFYYRKKNAASSKNYLISNLLTFSLLFVFYSLYLNFKYKLTFLGAAMMRIGTSNQSVEHRYTFINDAISLIFQNPILGVGPKMYKTAAVESAFLGTSDPHNAWLWVGGEMGLISFFITIGLSLFCLIMSFRYGYFYKNLKSIHLIVVALCIHGLVSGLLFSMKIFWIIMALLIGLQKFSSKEKLILR